MFCSLTFALGVSSYILPAANYFFNLIQGIELFFCLYAREWNDPVMCNSSHSRLLGFLTALPGIWRALQCIRRYHDTKVVYPHLYNCGKYTWTILYYMTLSLYRVDKSHQMRALFIVCATINGVYCGKNSLSCSRENNANYR